jgi:hypothetical protein
MVKQARQSLAQCRTVLPALAAARACVGFARLASGRAAVSARARMTEECSQAAEQPGDQSGVFIAPTPLHMGWIGRYASPVWAWVVWVARALTLHDPGRCPGRRSRRNPVVIQSSIRQACHCQQPHRTIHLSSPSTKLSRMEFFGPGPGVAAGRSPSTPEDRSRKVRARCSDCLGSNQRACLLLIGRYGIPALAALPITRRMPSSRHLQILRTARFFRHF